MYKSYEFAIEVWPGSVRIHQGEDTDCAQVIELDHAQVEFFCEALKKLAIEAKELGLELERKEAEIRTKKAIAEAVRSN